VSFQGAQLLKVTAKVVFCREPLQGIQIIPLPELIAVKQWKFNGFEEQRFTALSDKFTLYKH